MSETSDGVRAIAWREAVPFVRLFSTLSRALAFGPMTLAFCAVVSGYLVGRSLDALWTMAGAGVRDNELVAYAISSGADFTAWRESQAATSAPSDAPGPFIALLNYESQALGGALRGVLAGNWGMTEGPFSNEPSLLGGLFAASRGTMWLLSERPWFAFTFGVFKLIILAFFGGAICRCVAVRETREENLPLREALKFASQKFVALVCAPMTLCVALVGVGALATLGATLIGLLAAIPYLGAIFNVLAGLGFIFVLFAALFMMFILILVIFGYPLMTPTIATEGSDAFDAIQRAAGYLFPRAWLVAGYSFLLLLYGGISFLVVRIMGMLTLKFAHCVADAGLSLFGKLSNASEPALRKFDAIWSMPAWGDLPWLPGGGAHFWGSFANAPLGPSESILCWLVAFWVFLLVAGVVAFLLSFFFAGGQEMYFLLRRHVDSVDYDEIYYEEDVEDDSLGAVEYKD